MAMYGGSGVSGILSPPSFSPSQPLIPSSKRKIITKTFKGCDNLHEEWPLLLQSSIESRDFLLGKAIHGFLLKSSSHNAMFEGNNLINMYAKFNQMNEAHKLFDKMPQRNSITWTSLIHGYSQMKQQQKDEKEEENRCFYQSSSFQLARQLHSCEEGVKFTEHTCAALLQVCCLSPKQSLIQGQQLHCLIIKSGFESNIYVGTCLLSMYSKTGSVSDADKVFNDIGDVDLQCFNSMILEHGKTRNCKRKIQLLYELIHLGFEPNRYTFTNAISTCMDVNEGKQLHGLSIKYGMSRDICVSNALITMYSEEGLVKESELIFSRMEETNCISCTSLLSAYVKNGCGRLAIKEFARMLELGIISDFDSCYFTTMIGACSMYKEDMSCGFQIHGMLIKLGYASDAYIGTTLIDYYAKCGSLELARLVLVHLSNRNVASFNAIFYGYGLAKDNGNDDDDEIRMLNYMRLNGFVGDSVTFSQVLSLSANHASMMKGKSLHACVIKLGLEDYIDVSNALITMYAKCGCIQHAHQVFDKLEDGDIVSWNAILSAFALHGQGEDALLLFEEMQNRGFQPDEISLVSILQACAYAGLYANGVEIYSKMEREYRIKPKLEHVACFVHLLCRAQKLHEAIVFVQGSPFSNSPLLWRIIVNACRLCRNLEFGVLSSKRLLDLAPDDASSYVLVSSMYCAGEMLTESAKLRVTMNSHGLKKEAGCSWVEIDNFVHKFVASGKDHSHWNEIHIMLNNLNQEMRNNGYLPETYIDL